MRKKKRRKEKEKENDTRCPIVKRIRGGREEKTEEGEMGWSSSMAISSAATAAGGGGGRKSAKVSI